MGRLVALALAPAFALVFAAEASGYYFGGLEDYAAGVPSQEEKSSFLERYEGDILYETLYTGRFEALGIENRTLVIESEAPGFLGPEGVTVPLAVSEGAAVDLCSAATGECERVGTDGWESLVSIPEEELQGATVVVMGYPEDQTRIISIIK